MGQQEGKVYVLRHVTFKVGEWFRKLCYVVLVGYQLDAQFLL